jgi:deferrochelatase/peroxidase EfeB
LDEAGRFCWETEMEQKERRMERKRREKRETEIIGRRKESQIQSMDQSFNYSGHFSARGVPNAVHKLLLMSILDLLVI